MPQVKSVIKGIKPLQSILRIGSAAGQLLAIPADALRKPHPAVTQSAVPLSRQIQRGIFGMILDACTSVLPAPVCNRRKGNVLLYKVGSYSLLRASHCDGFFRHSSCSRSTGFNM